MDAEVVKMFRNALPLPQRRTAGLNARPWIRQTKLRLEGNHCVYCGRELIDKPVRLSADTWTIDHVIPLSLGGPDLSRNLVLACNHCNARKGRREWLSFGLAVDKKDMLLRRDILKSRCLNHLVRDPLNEGWTRLKVQRILDARWEHARSAVSALVRPDGVLIGAYGTARDYPPEITALLASMPGAKIGPYRIAQVADPRAGLDVIWQLISLNALMRRVQPEGLPDMSAEVAATPDDARWWESYRAPRSILWRGQKPVPNREPTRPGGMRPRLPDGEGWRSKKRLRALQDMTRRVERGDLDGSRERTPPEVIAAYDALLDGLVEVYHPEAIPFMRRYQRLARKGRLRKAG